MELVWRGEVVATQVEAAGAVSEIRFGWSQAQEALDAIEAALDRVRTEQIDRAEWNQRDLTDWAGPFRTEFDTVFDEYDTDATSCRTKLNEVVDTIIAGAEAANTEQRRRNDDAADDQASQDES